MESCKKSFMRQSETISFCPAHDRPRELQGIQSFRVHPLLKYPHRPPPLNTTRSHSLTSPDIDIDRQSMASVFTVATTSTTTSCSSLYRIPTKMRKLSSSSSSKSAKNPHSFPARPSAPLLSSLMPKHLKDVASLLWSENPDRDPFNTFAVSETELTSAIAHLEHQLGTSTRGKTNKARTSLFSSIFPSDAALSPSSSPGTPASKVSSDLRPSLSRFASVDDNQIKYNQENDCSSKQLPFRVQFIMESYCNIYMMR